MLFCLIKCSQIYLWFTIRRKLYLCQVIAEKTQGGVDYSFECIGNTGVLYQSFLATREVKQLVFFPFLIVM